MFSLSPLAGRIFFLVPKKGRTIPVRFYVQLHMVSITHSLTYKNTMQYSSITILPTNHKIKEITHTAFFCTMAYDALDGSTHDNDTFNLNTEKTMQYSSITILPTNHKIKKIRHTAFFCMMAYDTLDGSIHDNKTFNLNTEKTMQYESTDGSCMIPYLHLWVSLLCSWSLLSKIELALPTYVTF